MPDADAAPASAPTALSSPRRRSDRWPVPLWLGAGLAIGAATWIGIASTHRGDAEQLQMVNRWLVRAGLPFFVAAFVASPLARLQPSAATRRLVRERRGLGLTWASIHLTHAAAVLTLFDADAASIPPPFVLAFGGTGFALTAAMAVTSNDASQRALGRGWGRLHRTGLWYLTFIYTYTYLGRVLEGHGPWPVLALALMLGIVGLRAVAWLRTRRARRAVTAGV